MTIFQTLFVIFILIISSAMAMFYFMSWLALKKPDSIKYLATLGYSLQSLIIKSMFCPIYMIMAVLTLINSISFKGFLISMIALTIYDVADYLVKKQYGRFLFDIMYIGLMAIWFFKS